MAALVHDEDILVDYGEGDLDGVEESIAPPAPSVPSSSALPSSSPSAPLATPAVPTSVVYMLPSALFEGKSSRDDRTDHKTSSRKSDQGRERERGRERQRPEYRSSRNGCVEADLTSRERECLPRLRQDRLRDVCPRVAEPKRGRCSGPNKCRYRYHYLPDLIVNCLPYKFSANDLKRLFEAYGTVLYASVQATSKDKQQFDHEQTGFLHFAKHSDAQRAIDALDKSTVLSKSWPLKVAWTDKSKGIRYGCGTGEERKRDNKPSSREKESRRRCRDTPSSRSSHFPYLPHRSRNHDRERSRSPNHKRKRSPSRHRERSPPPARSLRPEFQSFPRAAYAVPPMSSDQFEQVLQHQVQLALFNMGVMPVSAAYSSSGYDSMTSGTQSSHYS